MSNLREQLSRMKREYRVQAGKLDERIESLAARTDQGFEAVASNMQAMSGQMQVMAGQIQELNRQVVRLSDQMISMNERMEATSEGLVRLREDHREVTRTMLGRSRLLEDRFGKMLDVVQGVVEEQPTRAELDELERRLRALEERDSAA